METNDGCHAPSSLPEEAFASSLQAAPHENENEAGSNDRKGIEHAGRAAAGTETQPTQYMVMTVAAGPVTETAREGQSHVGKTKKEEGSA
jgi:hypothetical protein